MSHPLSPTPPQPSKTSQSQPHALYDAKKSWKEANRIKRLIRLKAQIAQKSLATAVQETEGIVLLFKELYAVLPKTDGTMFGVSPINPTAVMEYLMEYIFKIEGKELNFTRRIRRKRDINAGTPEFMDAIDTALGWAFKFAKEDDVNDLV